LKRIAFAAGLNFGRCIGPQLMVILNSSFKDAAYPRD
jgi:hypothetical protein